MRIRSRVPVAFAVLATGLTAVAVAGPRIGTGGAAVAAVVATPASTAAATAAATVAFVPYPATGTELYVDNATGSNCSDSGAGSQSQPFCTIAAAASAAQPGQVVIVEPGAYAGATISAQGTPDAPITFTAILGATIQGTPASQQTPGTPAFTVSGAHNVVLNGFSALAVGPQAIDVTGGSSGITINGGYATTNSGAVPSIEVDGTSSGVTVSRMAVQSRKPIQVDPGASGVVITGNTLLPASAGNWGVLVTDAPGADVTGNTIQGLCSGGISMAGASSGVTVENNIVQPESSTCPTGTAISVSAGSEANYTALVCALTRAEPRFGLEGVRAFAGAPTVYVSRDCQPGWFKVAHQCGIGRAALRLIGTDGRGRLDAAQLAGQLARDRAAGARAVMIAPTAGTTGAGMIDPLQRCGELAREYGAWLHVDAAWGGALLCSPRLRGLLAGIEQADSLTIDAHKWFAATMGCGMFLTRHADTVAEAFRVTADFMLSNSEVLDPYLTTLQWSRRFMGLRLFLSLAAAGWQGYAAHVERAVALIEVLARRLASRGWRVRNEPRLAVLCVTPPEGPVPVRQIVQRVLRSGNAWVAATRFEGEDAVRICATHGESSEQDLQLRVSALEQARAAAAA